MQLTLIGCGIKEASEVIMRITTKNLLTYYLYCVYQLNIVYNKKIGPFTEDCKKLIKLSLQIIKWSFTNVNVPLRLFIGFDGGKTAFYLS